MITAGHGPKALDVVCFGDLLMDFVPTESGLDFADLPTFVPVPPAAWLFMSALGLLTWVRTRSGGR